MKQNHRVLICGDVHLPYHDPAAIEALIKFAADFRPDELVMHGDLLDFEAFSRFAKNPRTVSDPQRELDEGRALLARLAKAAGAKRRVWGYGNHEYRLQSLLMKQAPALLTLRSLDLHELLGLDGWRVIPHEQWYKTGNLVVHHGVSYGPTVNAKNIGRFGGFNVVQGHSHRLTQTFVRSLHGVHSAVEAGCLCDLNPTYCHHPNWAQGFATLNRGHLNIHLIEKGKVIA